MMEIIVNSLLSFLKWLKQSILLWAQTHINMRFAKEGNEQRDPSDLKFASTISYLAWLTFMYTQFSFTPQPPKKKKYFCISSECHEFFKKSNLKA